ncbi:MAG TPA: hypothetical protein VLJ59_20585 [Mycobacteriales bacterium]|nr:hypothetical protein [Mycobacteriales bacterium]
MRHLRWFAAVLVVAGVTVSGCGARGPGLGEASNNAVTVEAIDGTDVQRVILAPEAAQRLGVRTEAVRSAPAGGEARTVIPFAAVFYDADGITWTFTSPTKLTFVRQRITVDRIEGDLAYLREGPALGTAVVTVGAAELFGAEYGVGGE